MSELAATMPGHLQVAALEASLRGDGAIDQHIVERMASHAGVEPDQMGQQLATIQAGMETAIYNHLAPLGVYDREAFATFVHSSEKTHRQMLDSTRDLMMSNSTAGFEALAKEFAMSADIADPEGVQDALEEAGIAYQKLPGGGVLLDLTKQGLGQMTFREAVRAGVIKLNRNK